MLSIGTDTYINVEWADKYIGDHFLPDSTERKRWEELDLEEKEVFLRIACAELERLPWQGAAIKKDQLLAFPREPFQLTTATEAPSKIKNAQAELALWLSDKQAQTDAAQREQLKLEGVQSISLGSLSMAFADSGNIGDSLSALTCPQARRLVIPYIRGGYDTA